jgi:hypothetical protein
VVEALLEMNVLDIFFIFISVELKNFGAFSHGVANSSLNVLHQNPTGMSLTKVKMNNIRGMMKKTMIKIVIIEKSVKKSKEING